MANLAKMFPNDCSRSRGSVSFKGPRKFSGSRVVIHTRQLSHSVDFCTPLGAVKVANWV